MRLRLVTAESAETKLTPRSPAALPRPTARLPHLSRAEPRCRSEGEAQAQHWPRLTSSHVPIDASPYGLAVLRWGCVSRVHVSTYTQIKMNFTVLYWFLSSSFFFLLMLRLLEQLFFHTESVCTFLVALADVTGPVRAAAWYWAQPRPGRVPARPRWKHWKADTPHRWSWASG